MSDLPLDFESRENMHERLKTFITKLASVGAWGKNRSKEINGFCAGWKTGELDNNVIAIGN